ncbi:MAG: hypothetical protein K0R82_2670 [Flavipsychrobacter sp.]|nr:hypothetical protein [Flavipsychrobacter sp.]
MRLHFKAAWWALTVLISISYNAYTQSRYLYPYRTKSGWGFSTEQKEIVIPCVHEKVSMTCDYYLAKTAKGWVCYDNQARLLDSAGQLFTIASDHLLLLARAETPVEMTEMDEVMKDFFGALEQMDPWQRTEPTTGWLRDSLYAKLPLPDSVIAVYKEYPSVVWLRNGSKQGIYDALERKYLVPMQRADIRLVSDYYFIVMRDSNSYDVVDLGGKSYKFPTPVLKATNIKPDGKGFTTRENDLYIEYDSNGSVIRRPEGTPVYEQRVETNRLLGYTSYIRGKPGEHIVNNIRFYDPEGKILLNGVAAMDMIHGSHFIVWRHDSVTDKTDVYVYDALANKKVFSLLDANGRELNKDRTLFTARDTARKVSRYYSYKGKLLMSVPDSILDWKYRTKIHDLVQRMDVSKISYDGTHRSVHYTLLRDRKNKPFTIYDDDFNVVSEQYDLVHNQDASGRYSVVRGRGKWGVVAGEFRVVLPLQYDSISARNPLYYLVKKDGKMYWTDTTGRALVGGKYFDGLSPNPVNGRWLAFKYKPVPPRWEEHRVYEEVDTAYVLDDQGNVISTWKVDAEDYKYELTANGMVIRYPERSYSTMPAQLFDPVSKTVKSFPGIYFSVESYRNNPILVECFNEQEEKTVFSALDMSTVLPEGKYQYMHTSDRSLLPEMKKGVMVEGTTENENGQREKETVGYYTIDGVRYWED